MDESPLRAVAITFNTRNIQGGRLWGVTKIVTTLKDGVPQLERTMLAGGVTPLPQAANHNVKE
jgi:hypothetical protein